VVPGMTPTAALAVLAAGVAAGMTACAPLPPPVTTPQRTTEGPASTRRPFTPVDGDRWLGQGICYGPHRDGQRPGGPGPTRAQLREDLELLRGRWSVLRVYGSDGPTPELLDLIAAERLPFKVLVGAWIAPEPDAAAREANRAQVEGAARLANQYPALVLAVVVGNETQVSWSDHRTPPELLIGWLREARRLTAAPVTTADDFAYWVVPGSEVVASEIDLLINHVHPLWNGISLAGALEFTQRKVAEVSARHPGLPQLLGETGWATRKAPVGDQATLIKGVPDTESQAAFLRDFSAWAARERLPYTWFEAFDENWKGGPHPDEVEKHWGLFRADRTPKAAAAVSP